MPRSKCHSIQPPIDRASFDDVLFMFDLFDFTTLTEEVRKVASIFLGQTTFSHQADRYPKYNPEDEQGNHAVHVL